MKLYLYIFFFACTSTVIFAYGKPEPIVIPLLQTTNSWDGEFLPPYFTGQPEITVFKAIIPPGALAPLHNHPTIGTYYLMKGELTVHTNDGKVLHATAGNAYSEVVNKWHWGINQGNENVELIFFFAGIQGMSNTIE